MKEFREKAREQILALIANAKEARPKQPKKVKKIQAGC